MAQEKTTPISKIENMIEKHEKIFVICMMILASMILSRAFFSVYPLHTTTDELGAIVGAATLAGYDWSGVIEQSGYYGFGYYALFAPLFKLNLSPVMIYRLILVTTRILRGSIISFIVYYIGKKYYRYDSKLNLLLVSIICSIPLYPNYDANIVNDVVLDIFLWLVILSICKIAENTGNRRKCIKWIMSYLLLSFWGLFLHTRAVIIVIASVMVLTGILIYKREKVLLFSGGVILLTLLGNELIKQYQNYIWSGKEGLANTSASVTKNFSLLDSKTWEIWIHMLVGHVSVQTLLTGGLFLLAIVGTINYLWCVFVQKGKSENVYVNIVLAVSILCIGGAFAAFLVSNWFGNMYNTWDTAEKGKVYAYKALTYVRYWNVFAMPFLFSGIYLSCKKEKENCIKKTLFLGIILMYAFVNMIIPVVQNNSDSASFLFTYLTDRTEKYNESFYYKSILICMFATAISFILYHKKAMRRYAILPILLLMVWGYDQANENYNAKVTEKASAMVLASYEKKCVLEQNGIEIGQIYAVDERNVDRNWYIFSILQFYFYEYRIEDEYPKVMKNNDIIITCSRNKKIEQDFPMLNCYELDKNEVWYTQLDLTEYMVIEE